MSDVVSVALIAAIPGALSVVLSFANNVIGRKNAERMSNIETHTNGLKDALVKVTGESEFAKGLKKGQEEGQ